MKYEEGKRLPETPLIALQPTHLAKTNDTVPYTQPILSQSILLVTQVNRFRKCVSYKTARRPENCQKVGKEIVDSI